MKRRICIFFSMAVGAWAPLSFSQSRNELADVYLDHVLENQTIYQSTPISHIVPNANTITYSVAALSKKIKVTSPKHTWGKSNTLELGGYNVSPYLALSLRNIGLGFSVEAGRETVQYQHDFTVGGPNQKSQLDYSGVGIFLFNAPFDQSWKRVRPSMVLGGRMLNARHQLSGTKWGEKATRFDQHAQSYTVFSYEAGFNVNLKLFENFSLIPWVDYNHLDSRKASAIADKQSSEMRTDIQLFWHNKPRVTYGLDFSVRFSQLEVRLGGLLGAIASYGSEVDYIEDSSLSISLSVDQKGS